MEFQIVVVKDSELKDRHAVVIKFSPQSNLHAVGFIGGGRINFPLIAQGIQSLQELSAHHNRSGLVGLSDRLVELIIRIKSGRF